MAIKSQIINGIQEVSCEELQSQLPATQYQLVDVRRPDEYTGELGHIVGTKLITLGPDLQAFIDGLSDSAEVIFICRSGGRSGQATSYAQQRGLSKVYNMTGGMLRWNELHFPIEK